MNTITIELCAEDRARLDKILEALTKGRPDCTKCAQNVVDYVTAVTGVDEYSSKAEEHPVTDPYPYPAPKKEEAPEPEKPQTPKVTVADVQQKVVALSAAGKKEAVRGIVMAYATNVSNIPEDKLAEVLGKLNALEG